MKSKRLIEAQLIAAVLGLNLYAMDTGPQRRKPVEIPELPPGEAPEELRQPLLKGRRGKGTRRARKGK
jgi:hypothetical protein